MAGELTHLSLFTGIGGLDLAAEAAGFRTIGQCESGDFQTRILEQHWPDVPRWRDIRDLKGGEFYEATGQQTATVISGGFPCQPFSTAGKQRGEADDRFLWPEMFRVVRELRPTWVIGENVTGIIRLALDDVLSDLESEDYSCRAFVLPACAVGAPHRRDRIAIVAHSNSIRPKARSAERLQRQTQQPNPHQYFICGGGTWQTEPGVGVVADGVPDRLDRLQVLGNAVVPEQFYPIFRAIREIEEGDQ